MAATAVLGVALAVLVERTDLPARRLWHGLLVAPLAVPAFVNGYAWVSLDRSVHGFAGAFGVVTLSYYPLVYLPVVAMLRRLDPALEESAWSLGHSRARTFRTVVLPQLRPALLGGALLVGLHLLAEFGALSLLRFPTFTTAIYDQYGSTFNGAAATAMAGVLVLLCLFLLLADLRLRGDRRYARVGRGAARGSVPLALGPWRWPLVATTGAVVALAVGVPAFSLVRWLVIGTSTQFPLADLAEALVTTILLALAGAVVTTLAAVPVVWLAVRHRGWASTLIERSSYVANALPGIVVGLALVVASLRLVPVVYQTATLLVAAYAILFLPRAVVTVRAGLEQAPVVLDDVAHSLGVGPLATARRVTLPLIAPSLGAGAALVFLAISTELTATLMLSPIGTTHPRHRVLVGLLRAPLRRRGALRPAARAGLRPRDRAADAHRQLRRSKGDRMSSLTVTGVTKSFPSTGRGHAATRAVDDVTLHVPHGSFTTVLGPSGCGKTTLLRLIAGFLVPDSGSIAFGDTVVAGDGVRPMPPQTRRVGYVPQEGALFPHLERGRQHRASGSAARPASRAATTGSPRCSTSSSCPPTSATADPTSSPAASSSAWRWPARSRRSPPSCCSTSRSRPSTPSLRGTTVARRAPGPPGQQHHRRPGHPRPERGPLPRRRGGGHARRATRPVGLPEPGLPVPERPPGRRVRRPRGRPARHRERRPRHLRPGRGRAHRADRRARSR